MIPNVNVCKKFAWFPNLGSSLRANKEAIEPSTIPYWCRQTQKAELSEIFICPKA